MCVMFFGLKWCGFTIIIIITFRGFQGVLATEDQRLIVYGEQGKYHWGNNNFTKENTWNFVGYEN